jgi:hypothetical protein
VDEKGSEKLAETSKSVDVNNSARENVEELGYNGAKG